LARVEQILAGIDHQLVFVRELGDVAERVALAPDSVSGPRAAFPGTMPSVLWLTVQAMEIDFGHRTIHNQRALGPTELLWSDTGAMKNTRVYKMSFAGVYPHYVAKAEKKGRTKAEVDVSIRWLTGYSEDAFEALLENRTDFDTFFAEAPALNPARTLIKGTICGVRIEEIEEPLMREIRYLDKLIDELAKGNAMEKILRK
jgi:hypothetical protein